MIEKYLLPFYYLINEMSPYLLLGLAFAGVLHAFVPKGLYSRLLGKNNFSSVLWAILFGVPLPLCSCGVIPTAVGMRKEGASKGATTAFLIATPQTGVDSILATYSVFGLPFALMRPIVAMITGIVGGIATNFAARHDAEDDNNSEMATPPRHSNVQGRDNTTVHCSKGETDENATIHNSEVQTGVTTTEHICAEHTAGATFAQKCLSAVDYAFDDMLVDIGQWLLIGIVLAGLITIFVPDDFFMAYQGNHLVNMLLVLLIACPMYVCATGSIPIAAALMIKGLSPGAALVFLMAGPATNMASIMVLGKTLGRRSLVAYLVTIISGAICFGLLVDLILPMEWFSGVMEHSLHGACCHTESTPLWQTICTVCFLLLLVRALFKRHHHDGCGCGHDHGCSEHSCHCDNDSCHCDGDSCHCDDDSCHCDDDGCHFDEHDCQCGGHDNGCSEHGCHCDEHENGTPAQSSIVLRVEGMMCNHCVKHVNLALAQVQGVTAVEVSLATGMASVTGSADPDALVAAVVACGYKCSIL